TEILWVVIPAYNEELYITSCLKSFARQTDGAFRIVVVDNASTDQTREVALQTARDLGLEVDVVSEKRKGTGWASRRGFDYAIEKGARILARTDADCEVDINWVKEMRVLLGRYDFVGGVLKIDASEPWIVKAKFVVIYAIIWWVVGWRRVREGGYRKRFLLAPGGNLGITAKMYTRVGGFSQSSIETLDEDTDLASRVLRVTRRAIGSRRVAVTSSSRRLVTLGFRGTLRWYGFKTEQGDIR